MEQQDDDLNGDPATPAGGQPDTGAGMPGGLPSWLWIFGLALILALFLYVVAD